MLVSKICGEIFTMQQEKDKDPQRGKIYQEVNSEKGLPECRISKKWL